MMRRYLTGVALCLAAAGCAPSAPKPIPPAPIAKHPTRAQINATFKAALRMTEEHQYQSALDLYQWLKRNAMGGAVGRDSFFANLIVNRWAELGERYPKAKEALSVLRDEDLEEYRKSGWDQNKSVDLMDLNIKLKDTAAMKSLYYEVREHGVTNRDLIAQVDTIVAAGDQKWARDILGDPDTRLRDLAKDHRDILALLKSRPKISPRIFQAVEFNHRRNLAVLIRATAGVYGKPKAIALQKEALKQKNAPEVRDALK